jgi:HSP20 family protein
MNLVTYHPFKNLEPFLDTDRFFNRPLDDFFPNSEPQAHGPSVNLTENDNGFELTAEVPGMKEDEIHVEVHEGVLTLRGHSEEKNEAEEGPTYRIREIKTHRFERAFRLGSEVDHDKVTARLENGILHVTLAKIETAKPRKIDVKITS